MTARCRYRRNGKCRGMVAVIVAKGGYRHGRSPAHLCLQLDTEFAHVAIAVT